MEGKEVEKAALEVGAVWAMVTRAVVDLVTEDVAWVGEVERAREKAEGTAEEEAGAVARRPGVSEQRVGGRECELTVAQAVTTIKVMGGLLALCNGNSSGAGWWVVAGKQWKYQFK